MIHRESELQKACVRWFRMQYPGLLIYANANGGRRSKIEAAIMQGEGVLAGIPDLTVVLPGAVLWVELKAPNVKAHGTHLQQAMIKKLNGLGHFATVVNSLEDFMRIINTNVNGNVN